MLVKKAIDQFKLAHGSWCALSCYIEYDHEMIYEGPIPENGIIINDRDISKCTVYDFSIYIDVDKRSAKICLTIDTERR